MDGAPKVRQVRLSEPTGPNDQADPGGILRNPRVRSSPKSLREEKILILEEQVMPAIEQLQLRGA